MCAPHRKCSVPKANLSENVMTHHLAPLDSIGWGGEDIFETQNPTSNSFQNSHKRKSSKGRFLITMHCRVFKTTVQSRVSTLSRNLAVAATAAIKALVSRNFWAHFSHHHPKKS